MLWFISINFYLTILAFINYWFVQHIKTVLFYKKQQKMVTKLRQFTKLGPFSTFQLFNCPNFVTIFCHVLKMEIIFFISLAIPRPSRSGIHWLINFSKIDDSVYFQKKFFLQNWGEEKGHFSFLNCPNFVTFLCQVLKMEIIYFDIPSNPPPIAVRNSLANKFFQKNRRFCIFSTTKKSNKFI